MIYILIIFLLSCRMKTAGGPIIHWNAKLSEKFYFHQLTSCNVFILTFMEALREISTDIFLYLLLYIYPRLLGTSACFSNMFSQETFFIDFLFASPSKIRFTLKGKNLLTEERMFSFKSSPLLERKRKIIIAELPPLKVCPSS